MIISAVFAPASIAALPYLLKQKENGWYIVNDLVECCLDTRNVEKVGDYQFANFFIGMETKEAVFAGFSYPKGGESYRGYVTYVTEQHKDTFIDSLICYAHHRDWAQYPVQTGIEFLKTTTHSKKAFTYRQKILQVHPPTVEDGE